LGEEAEREGESDEPVNPNCLNAKVVEVVFDIV